MVARKFAFGFLIGFFVVLAVLSSAYVGIARGNFGSEVLAGVWAAIIILVVLFGIIVISVFVRSLRERRKKIIKKEDL